MITVKNERLSVLIIDDDNDILLALTEVVETLEYTAVAAQTVPMALIKINNQSFNCILLDLHLKKVSGLKLVQQIRRNGHSRNHDTPIILHSGHLETALLDQQKKDIDDAIVKPASLNVIREKITFWSQRKHIPAHKMSLLVSNSKSSKGKE